MVKTQYQTNIKALQTDWGGEYHSLSSFLASHGISHRISCPYTLQQSGKVERKNRHVLEVGLSILAHSFVPLKYWLFAFQTVIYLINRLPTPTLHQKSPYYLLHNSLPNYSLLKVFGCSYFPFLRPFNKHKLEFRSTKCIFLGYSANHKGYLCLEKSFGSIYISRHVVFNETIFLFPQ